MSRLQKPPAVLRELYHGIDGWEIPRTEARAVKAARSAETYGEIMPTATQRLLDYLDLGERDVFYDLGCGAGKVVVHAAITRPLARCVGIELSRTRCHAAHLAVHRARRNGLIRTRVCAIRCQDFMHARLDDATVIYTCSTAFPPALMRRLVHKLAGLSRLHTFVTLQDLDPSPHLELIDVLRLDMSWKRYAKVHVYETTTGRQRGSAPPQS